MVGKSTTFQNEFESLTGNRPFPWQEALYTNWFSQSKVPPSCCLPTGLGKTSVIAVWWIAREKMPRRLVYVVNRRTVVDQTTAEVEKLRSKLANGDRLAVSTLRGQFADNREWSADPSQPAVIIGTVDMIGSRLLFGGYGVGFKLKPLHAGFLGQDVLLVHDEAHLEPAFQELLDKIEGEQNRERERNGSLPWPALRVMQLTATSRNGQPDFMLTPAEQEVPKHIPDLPVEPIHHVWRRQKAKKVLSLHPAEKVAEKIIERAKAFESTGSAVLVFARTVEDVDKIAKGLAKFPLLRLTGTMRGKERDALVKEPIFQRFLPNSDRAADVTPAEGTVYLVCTSAGEVGVNLSADHMICDLSTFESMTQRFGRVNRFGDRHDTRIEVVPPTSFGKIDKKTGELKADEFEKRRQKTLELLRKFPSLGDNQFDASPKALGELPSDERAAAFSPAPTILAATDILFDAWALTTIREKLPGRPPVEPYLHGVSDWEPPETYVAWREEVGIIKDSLLDQYDPADLLEDYPLKPHELLRDRTDRVLERLKAWPSGAPVWIISSTDIIRVTTIEKLDEGELNDRTVLLSPSVGGLKDGLLDPKSTSADDVADDWANGKRRRVWNQKLPGWKLIRPEIVIPSDSDEDGESRVWRWYELPDKADAEASKSARKPVRLDVHTGDVAKRAVEIVERLGLPDNLRQAVIVAAKLHDAGKNRRVFQALLRNPNPNDPWAKSDKPSGNRDDYRHEFGSLLDAEESADFKELRDPEMRELVLHLIAAHHGRARPHFPAEEADDREPKGKDVSRIAAEVPRRFARLQRRYGRWGLAYLESLLRAADYAASANPSAVVEDNQ
jgi:CRISPR-associated endonuclease/helicase Cas3